MHAVKICFPGKKKKKINLAYCIQLTWCFHVNISCMSCSNFLYTNDLMFKHMQVLSSDTVFSVPMTETYSLLGVDSKDISSLEKYLQDYFTNILKKLKNIKAQSKQSDFYI